MGRSKRNKKFPIGTLQGLRKDARSNSELLEVERRKNRAIKKKLQRVKKLRTEAAGEVQRVQAETSKQKKVYKTSQLDSSGDKLTLKRTQRCERNKQTKAALEKIHGEGCAVEGAWAFINTFSNTENAGKVMASSSKVDSLFIVKKSSCSKDKVLTYASSLKLMYRGGVMSKRKYQAIRNSSLSESTPLLLPYGKVVSRMKALPKPTRFAFQSIDGYFTDLTESVRSVLELYIKLDADDNSGLKLEWFGKANHFAMAFGGDGAPLGTESGAVSHLISVLNVGKRVMSRDHNFLVCLAGTSKENHSEVVEYIQKVQKWIEVLEKEGLEIDGVKYTISFELLPVDQKYLAILGGELSNAATYPSSFGKVKKDLVSSISAAGLQPWIYKDRLSVASKVETFKAKNPKAARTKITQYIASLGSRQETSPPIGPSISKALIDPLHVKNNAWEKVNQRIVEEALKAKVVSKQKFSTLSLNHPVRVYGESLKSDVKAGKVFRKFVHWFDVEREQESSGFTCRFTGEDSTKLANRYSCLLEKLMSSEISEASKMRLYSIGYMACQLATVTVGMNKYTINLSDVESVKTSAWKFYVASTLFFTSGLLEWTVGVVVPDHMLRCFERFGVGLCINSTQGREAKHLAIKAYKAKTSPQTLHSKIMDHEFIDCVYLPLVDRSFETYKEAKSMVITVQNSIHLCGDVPDCKCQHIYTLLDRACVRQRVDDDIIKLFNG